VLAYHAAESFCRQVLAFIDGAGPNASPLIALTKLKAGQAFNDRLSRLVELPDEELRLPPNRGGLLYAASGSRTRVVS
jgi:hypothetical protein